MLYHRLFRQLEIKTKKIISDTNTCLDSCNNNITCKYEYLGKCYKNCQKDSLVVDNYNICSCELDQCLFCNSVSLSKNLCTKCNVNYYPKENDPLNLGEYINCYINPIGYYLDLNEGLYKKCYLSCETCELNGDIIHHNCLQCKPEFEPYLYNNDSDEYNYNYTNCYKKCNFYHYFDEEYNYHCTYNFSCPKDYPILIENKSECIYIKEEISTNFEYSREMYKDQLSTKQMVLDTYKDIANSFLVVKEPQEKDTLSETYLGEYNIEEINNIV